MSTIKLNINESSVNLVPNCGQTPSKTCNERCDRLGRPDRVRVCPIVRESQFSWLPPNPELASPSVSISKTFLKRTHASPDRPVTQDYA